MQVCPRRRFQFHRWFAAIVLAGCSNAPTPASEAPGAAGSGGSGTADPAPGEGDPVDYLQGGPSEPVVMQFEVPDQGAVGQALVAARRFDATSLAADRAVSHVDSLSYDPTSAAGMDLIQASTLGLNSAELELLGQRGFAIVPRQEYPTFTYGYASIYAADLPVFISADMLLEAVHQSFDAILQAVELGQIRGQLVGLLDSLQSRLDAGSVALDPETAADLDVYLKVARGLMLGMTSSTTPRVGELLTAATAARGGRSLSLFGSERRIDFSQFEPRGHYAGEPTLESYFRAMIWLGRTDFRLIETRESDGQQVFQPRQLRAALGLRALLDDAGLETWQRIDTTIGAFAGEHDDMTVLDLDRLLDALGVDNTVELAGIPDDRIAQAIVDGQFGQQRIASQLVRRGVAGPGTFPLSASFALFGQRYTVDSHVFSNLVYDRVGAGAVARVMPNPLDVAFAALGNDQAVDLLSTELSKYAYAGDLAAMRSLVDAHGDAYWQSSLYTEWLSALRALSPAPGNALVEDASLPEVARTEAWGRRMLNTQLASWAELRHDTLLYAKQSYTTGSLCEYPDAYVDPYPEFFYGITRFAERGQAMVDTALAPGATAGDVRGYFEQLAEVATILGDMAAAQRTGEPHSPEQLAFINDAISVRAGCAGPYAAGWYTRLFFDPDQPLKADPTIADVHTDPGGDIPVARAPSVLHVGTGNPRLMVMTRESCQGPRAYAGLVSSYYEVVEPGLTRLTDVDWQERVMGGPSQLPGDVPWLAPALAGR